MASTTTTDTAAPPAAAATSSSGGGGNQFFSLFRAHDVPVTSASSSPSSSDGGGGGRSSGTDGPFASTAPKQQQEQLTIFALSSKEPPSPPADGDAVTSSSSSAAASARRPGLLLVHGYPQTSHIWRLVADELVQSGKWEGVVVVDLRGYGRSSKPRGSESHIEYSKREMASDLVQVMTHFGHARFDILAHDRGARVVHRLALDHPERVRRMMLLDIAPTLFMYEKTDMRFAYGYWHWFFLIQPSPLAENMIRADPDAFWQLLTSRATHAGVKWDEETQKVYKEAYFTDEGIHGACEDYRASASIDLEHDRADHSSGRKLSIDALRVLWGGNGMIQGYGNVVGIWEGYCDETMKKEGNVSGRSLQGCGHYVPEEKDRELVKEVMAFF